jgi:hypothetical protein
VPTSAYAVDAQGNGSVTVHVRALSDAKGLQQSLREAGVPALVIYAPDSSLPTCPTPKSLQVQSHGSVRNEAGTPGAAPSGSGSGPSLGRSGAGLAPSPGGPTLRMHTSRAPKGRLGETVPGARTPPPGALTAGVQVTPDGVTFTVDPGKLGAGEELVIATSEGTLSSIGMTVVKKSAGPCKPAQPSLPATPAK